MFFHSDYGWSRRAGHKTHPHDSGCIWNNTAGRVNAMEAPQILPCLYLYTDSLSRNSKKSGIMKYIIYLFNAPLLVRIFVPYAN